MTYTPAHLQERTLHRRAIEAAIWGIPAVNYDAMYQALVRDAKGASNQIVYWSRLLDWKNQTLTPNPDAIYLMPLYDTTDSVDHALMVKALEAHADVPWVVLYVIPEGWGSVNTLATSGFAGFRPPCGQRRVRTGVKTERPQRSEDERS